MGKIRAQTEKKTHRRDRVLADKHSIRHIIILNTWRDSQHNDFTEQLSLFKPLGGDRHRRERRKPSEGAKVREHGTLTMG